MSRFDKYNKEGKKTSDQIANINNFIDWIYTKGLDLIEKEIDDLQRRIDEGANNAMFPKKVDQLISLGKTIETIHDTYHFNRE